MSNEKEKIYKNFIRFRMRYSLGSTICPEHLMPPNPQDYNLGPYHSIISGQHLRWSMATGMLQWPVIASYYSKKP